MTVLVTGAGGFIGKNLCVALSELSEVSVIEYEADNTLSELEDFIEKADFIFHLAGVNRPFDLSEFDKGNRGFTEQLLEAIEKSGRKIPVLMTSSIQAALGNPYGKSKREAEKAVLRFGERVNSDVYIYRLPNVFGKWCRPNYNSVIASFCYNIAHGLPIRVDNRDTILSLVYIDDVVAELINALGGRANRDTEKNYFAVPRVFRKTLGEIADLIYSFKSSRDTLIVPDMSDTFTKFLYATYISYLPQEKLGYNADMKCDNRGWLCEIIKSRSFGQIFVSRTKPGITRGNHWHHTKAEKFIVIEGSALVSFRKIDSDDIIEIAASGEDIKIIDIPAGYTHSITNTGESDLITLFWAGEIFDKQAPDTYYLGV